MESKRERDLLRQNYIATQEKGQTPIAPYLTFKCFRDRVARRHIRPAHRRREVCVALRALLDLHYELLRGGAIHSNY